MKGFRLKSCFVSGIIWCCLTPINVTQAQIVPDTTLPKNSVVTPNNMIWEITAGTVAGNNLFHSFKQFNIPEMHTADFINPSANIQNILVRVTGGSRSDIFGKIKTSVVGSPNLFLLNPHGILFGPNASLDVGGSFVATTANAIAFGNQGLFSASVPNNPALLTVNPSAFLFNQIYNSSITNQHTNLSVNPGQSLLLLGGNVSIDGGNLSAPGGRIELGAVAGEGTIELNTNNQNLYLSYADNLIRGDISILNGSANVRSNGNGNLSINAHDLSIVKSQLTGGLIGNFNQAGDIIIQATGKINITQSTITNNLGTRRDSATGNTGRIYIQAGSVFLNDSFIRSDVGSFSSSATGNTEGIYIKAGSAFLDNTALSASNFGRGSTGGIFIEAKESVSISNNSFINSDINSGGFGNTRGIKIISGSVFLNDTTLNAINSGEGNTNGVSITANNSVLLTNTAISTIATQESIGNASNLNIQARDIFSDFSSLDSSAFNAGVSGNIIINAQNIFLNNRSFIGTPVDSMASPGLIDINTRNLTLTNGAAISSITTGSRNGGNIQINATESVKLIAFSPDPDFRFFSSGLFTDTVGNAIGKAGNIDIKTRSLQITDGALVSASSSSGGRGGNINIIADTVDLVSGGQILTSASNIGNAGNITLEAKNRVSISGSDPTFAARVAELGTGSIGNDGANSGLFARVRGTERANAGDITVNTRFLRLNNRGTITTGTNAGEGGNINLNVRDVVLLRNNSSISANAGVANAGGNGGNININTQFLIAIPGENSDISANAFNGRGGRVDITAQSIFGITSRFRDTQFSDITASSQLGINGDVTINTVQVDPIQGLSELSTSVVDSSTLLAADCSQENENNNSQFVVTGRGGLPANPYELLGGDVLWSDTRTREMTARRNLPINIKSPAMEKTVAIAPANGWRFNGAGEVTLISQVSGAEENLLKSNPYACPKPTTMKN
ncbi:filamentous hemagglutinin N-terminal domain-containing protein [Aulosira sp. FACHB-615]|uniref:two-partner secretion domain-containing protein n=1 Tax=Aulosira sp. FACHB-615 TaxID=2692777 RepID=UPI00168411E7|nr:filamentous hemagglutinin N-terminal domain-containing protein [Aulosira sp. FACHB-615]MBD2486039.1 filamentous hemagglutinin N-terminal domain-containing protein [Aulosira sp. FACHB-615]